MFQFQDEKFRAVGFRSRTLVGAELRYHSSKLEFLALKWADYFSVFQICVDEVKAIFNGVGNQSCNAETWLPKVNIILPTWRIKTMIFYIKEGKQRKFMLLQISISLSWKIKL